MKKTLFVSLALFLSFALFIPAASSQLDRILGQAAVDGFRAGVETARDDFREHNRSKPGISRDKDDIPVVYCANKNEDQDEIDNQYLTACSRTCDGGRVKPVKKGEFIGYDGRQACFRGSVICLGR